MTDLENKLKGQLDVMVFNVDSFLMVINKAIKDDNETIIDFIYEQVFGVNEYIFNIEGRKIHLKEYYNKLVRDNGWDDGTEFMYDIPKNWDDDMKYWKDVHKGTINL